MEIMNTSNVIDKPVSNVFNNDSNKSSKKIKNKKEKYIYDKEDYDDLKSQKRFEYELDQIKGNLKTQTFTLYLNEHNIKLLRLYKDYHKQTFYSTLNIICRRSLDKLESICPDNYSRWLRNLYEFLDSDKAYEDLRKYIEGYLHIPDIVKKDELKHQDICVTLLKKYVDRIDKLKNNILFSKMTRDEIFTYLISLDTFEDLIDTHKISERYYYDKYKIELDRFSEEINGNFFKINMKIINNVVSYDILKRPHIPLFLTYLNGTLKLCEKDNRIFIDTNFKQILNDIKILLDEKEFDYKKDEINSGFLVGINDSLKKIDEIINEDKSRL